MPAESAPVVLARESLTYYLTNNRPMLLPAKLAPELSGQAGVFVSLKKNGRLRGCIGTFQPTTAAIGAEIIQNAISAGTEDPRFPAVKLAELADITISVDVLAAPEAVDSPAQLDPQKYGIIVRRGSRRGLLLPMLAGVDTVAEQIAIAREKAGISPGEEIELYRFTVTRYT
ncbi:MAG: AmmeMemoRadiSam system protein A [Veillonellales bacterium]